jgi:hypothetical protein
VPLVGIRLRPHDTPAEYAERVGAAVPVVRGPVADIAESYTRHVFSDRPSGTGEVGRIESNWRTVRQELLKKLLRWRGARRNESTPER